MWNLVWTLYCLLFKRETLAIDLANMLKVVNSLESYKRVVEIFMSLPGEFSFGRRKILHIFTLKFLTEYPHIDRSMVYDYLSCRWGIVFDE